MKKMVFLWLLIFVGVTMLFAEGPAESAAACSASSSGRGEYLAGEGIIIPPDEVIIDSYVASIDYRYPDPEGILGVTFRSGNRQISADGQDDVIHIGIQAKRMPFAELPPLNLAFVIDKSGSMGDENKMSWVKEAFEIFIDSVRDIDFVSLVVFESTADVIFPSTQMKSDNERSRFRRAVRGVESGGGTNLSEGLQLGYEQVMANFRKEYTNRVLFLTDGIGESAGILEMAEQFEKMGVNVSTIGVGTDFDQYLMIELARKGGGSSRFIAGREEMEEIFGSELSRMVVPAARNLDMHLTLADNIQILGTWGYNHRVTGNDVSYSQKTLHLGDYETILVSVRYGAGWSAGSRPVASFDITYEDLDGVAHSADQYLLDVDFVKRDYPVTGFSDGVVLKSGTMLHFAQNLQRIGEIYYNRGSASQQVGISSSRLQQAFDLTVDTRKELRNVRARLDNIGFDDEIEILERYTEIIGGELDMNDTTMRKIALDDEIPSPAPKRSLEENIESLFDEMTLSFRDIAAGVIAVSGFASSSGEKSGLTNFLDEMATVEMSRHPGSRIVERAKLADIIEEQKLSLYDLVDTSTAVKVGQLLAANYIVTGSVIEMASSVVIFARVINLESGEVESAAQVIVARDPEVEALLATAAS